MNRHPRNPILTRDDIPPFSPAMRDVSSVFNPGAIRLDGADLLMLRVQTRSRETALVPVQLNDDGTHEFFDGQAAISGLDHHDETVHHIYDPRLTRIEGKTLMVFAMDVTTTEGSGACRLGVASMQSPTRWTLIGVDRSRDSRNGVLFPQRIGGRYARLERPNMHKLAGGVATGSAIHVSTSDDLATWKLGGEVMAGRWRYWDELIGSGPPPLLTSRGWLHVYHGVATHFASSSIYQAGVSLLDRDHPSQLLSRGALNILEPREMYELVGQVPNVVFPSGMVTDSTDENSIAHDDEALRLYYGAADTCVGRFDTTVGELLDACEAEGLELRSS